MLRTTLTVGAPVWMGSRQALRVSHTSHKSNLTTIPVLHTVAFSTALDLLTAFILSAPGTHMGVARAFSRCLCGSSRLQTPPCPCTLHGSEQGACSSPLGRWRTREKPGFVLMGSEAQVLWLAFARPASLSALSLSTWPAQYCPTLEHAPVPFAALCSWHRKGAGV